MPVLQIELPNLLATQHLGASLAEGLKAGDIISLSGQLGAGKSALARSIIMAANPNETDVPSPTFSLVQTYELADRTPLWHLDLYRIENPEDAMQLGLDDAFVDAVCLIEWPDRLKKFLPKSTLSVHLCLPYGNDPDGFRLAEITVPTHWCDRLRAIIAKSS
jgi:tRNA threonylcarbamoyladenosine biosynthesis protein TsaE